MKRNHSLLEYTRDKDSQVGIESLNRGISIHHSYNKNYSDTPCIWNGPIQRAEIEESILHKRV